MPIRILFLLTAISILTATGCAHRRSPGDHPMLNANLWHQTSAEYRALCLQTYADARDHVEAVLGGAGVMTQGSVPTFGGKPLAVILDLDETVLDNSAFQTALIMEDKAYDPADWTKFVNERALEIPLVPGAKGFIEAIKARGVQPVYISNRDEADRAATIETLKHNGLGEPGLESAEGLKLLLKTDSSNKDARRAAAAGKYTVIAWIGDNLADFTNDYRPGSGETVESRKAKVDRDAAHFGRDWFVLPNATYGYWERVLDAEQPWADLNQ